MKEEIFSEIILDLYKNPVNFGHIKNHDLKVSGGNPICGDEVSFEVKVENEKIQDIKFTCKGCAISKASESMLTEMVKGKTIKEVKQMSNKEVFDSLGGVIQTRVKCALLGLMVLKRGIEKFEKSDGKKTVVEGLKI